MLERQSDIFVLYLAASVDWISTGEHGHTVDDVKRSVIIRMPSAFEKDPILKQKAEEFREQFAYTFAGIANLFAQRRRVSGEVAGNVRTTLSTIVPITYAAQYAPVCDSGGQVVGLRRQGNLLHSLRPRNGHGTPSGNNNNNSSASASPSSGGNSPTASPVNVHSRAAPTARTARPPQQIATMSQELSPQSRTRPSAHSQTPPHAAPSTLPRHPSRRSSPSTTMRLTRGASSATDATRSPPTRENQGTPANPPEEVDEPVAEVLNRRYLERVQIITGAREGGEALTAYIVRDPRPRSTSISSRRCSPRSQRPVQTARRRGGHELTDPPPYNLTAQLIQASLTDDHPPPNS